MSTTSSMMRFELRGDEEKVGNFSQWTGEKVNRLEHARGANFRAFGGTCFYFRSNFFLQGGDTSEKFGENVRKR